MTVTVAEKQEAGSKKGVVPFVTEIARYFMDFLETDFHKVRNPKRNIQHRNGNNLQITINLNKYKKYSSLAWKVIRDGFENDALNELKRGVHTIAIPQSLLQLIQNQINAIEPEAINALIKQFRDEIDLGISKNPNDTTAAITFALDGIVRVIREKFLVAFIYKIKEPLDKIRTATVDSVYQVEEELTDILIRPFEDVVSSMINQISLGNQIEAGQSLEQVFELQDVQNKLESFFKGFAAGDLFFEVSELVNNKSLLEKQEFYLYFCDISYKNQTYPLFYIPIQIQKTTEGFAFSFDSLLYVNKKAVQFISQDHSATIERKGSLGAFMERIIYLAEKREHLLGEIDLALKEAINYFGLTPYIDINNPERQVAKGQGLQITNSCYLGLFDKSDESLINDYEEILQKLKSGDDVLAAAFQLLVDDFITNNPVSVVAEVEHDWDNTTPSAKLVYASPVPLNEEQRQILGALNKAQCKYITVEGPPGTGKSHTITAIVCDAILKNQSILVLSDKKEALDVVEDKITETMNKVRQDNQFQNPILRLGQAGNTYSKILSSTSMERINEHYKAVRTEYKKLETNIDQSVLDLKKHIGNTITAYEKIKLADIAEFTKLESTITANANLPVDLIELHSDQLSDDNLMGLRNDMRELKAKLADQQSNLANLFKNFYSADNSIVAFRHFITFLDIVDELRIKANQALTQLSQIHNLSTDGLAALESYITRCNQLKSSWFGFFLKGKQVTALNNELAAKLPNDFTAPHMQLEELKGITGLFRMCWQLKEAQEISSGFQFNQDFNKSVHQMLTLDLHLPTTGERKDLLDAISNIEAKLNQYSKTATKIGATSSDIFSYTDNALTKYPDSEFDHLVRYLYLKNDLQDHFNNIPEHNYVINKKIIEELVTTQMTYKMDERVVDFYQNHKNDAKSLSGVISKKQRFDKASFDKLKSSFPCILASIRDFAEYIPLEYEIFDLVILDEASQVSIAQAFPALLRGKKIIVLGDKKQFSNVKSSQARSDTNREYLNRLRDVFIDTISDESTKLERLGKFNIKTSILEFFERISNYNIMLKKHFRGYRELISYSSKYFYNDNLQAIKIRATPIEDTIKFSFIEHDGRMETVENSNQPEREAIVAEVERIVLEEPNLTIGIITPHTNQQKLLVDTFAKHPDFEHFTEQHKLKIMTFDTCQGEERDIILYSMVASAVSDKLWGIFIKDRNSVDLEEGGQIKLQRLNVGFSRAKERMDFYLSQPVEDYTGSIGEALRHYRKTFEEAKQLPDTESTDQRSPMEKKVLHWMQETAFFKANKAAIELHTQFPLGKYIKQLDKRYKHPAFVVDFLLVYTDAEGKKYKIIIEYDGFEFHFQDFAAVNEFNYGEYHTEQHVYREKVLESYGYNFLRINRFNVGKDPVAALSARIEALVKKKSSANHALVDEIHKNIDGLQSGRMKECQQCKKVKVLDDFKDGQLRTGYGRFCNECKGQKEPKTTKPKPQPALTDVKCPRCSSQMVVRERKWDKHKFYGCSHFPRCKGTRDFTSN
jgi:very-short-patch-repair endonuclease